MNKSEPRGPRHRFCVTQEEDLVQRRRKGSTEENRLRMQIKKTARNPKMIFARGKNHHTGFGRQHRDVPLD